MTSGLPTTHSPGGGNFGRAGAALRLPAGRAGGGPFRQDGDLCVVQNPLVAEVAVAAHGLRGRHLPTSGVVAYLRRPGLRLLIGLQRERRGLSSAMADDAVGKEDRRDVASIVGGIRRRRFRAGSGLSRKMEQPTASVRGRSYRFRPASIASRASCRSWRIM